MPSKSSMVRRHFTSSAGSPIEASGRKLVTSRGAPEIGLRGAARGGPLPPTHVFLPPCKHLQPQGPPDGLPSKVRWTGGGRQAAANLARRRRRKTRATCPACKGWPQRTLLLNSCTTYSSCVIFSPSLYSSEAIPLLSRYFGLKSGSPRPTRVPEGATSLEE